MLRECDPSDHHPPLIISTVIATLTIVHRTCGIAYTGRTSVSEIVTFEDLKQMTRGKATISNVLYYQISFLSEQRLFFSYDFSSPSQDPCVLGFLRLENTAYAGFPSRGSLEIQAETAMNHILIDSTGAPRPPCRLLPSSFASCGNRASGKTFASGITKTRVWFVHREKPRVENEESTLS